MIVDARQLPTNEKLAADLCIIGAGVSGITLAHELLGSGLKVILADGGAEAADAGEARCEGRRTFGQAEESWGRGYAPFDPIDFTRRPWIPHSGWPIANCDLAPAYRRAMGYVDAGRFLWRVRTALPDHPADMIDSFNDPGLPTDRLERFTRGASFAERFRDPLAGADNVQMLLHAKCLRIGLSADGQSVERLYMAAEPGRPFVIEAATCVVAAGGLETPRLLLLSDDVMTCGVGNQNGLVGRFYMRQLEGRCALLHLRPDARGVCHVGGTDADGVYCRRHLSIHSDIQRSRRLASFAARLGMPIQRDDFGVAASGARMRRSPIRRGIDWIGHRSSLGGDTPATPGHQTLMLRYAVEQMPDSESRVLLGLTRDPYGRRLLHVDWRTTGLDDQMVAACHRFIQERLHAPGIGDLEYDEERLLASKGPIPGQHLGTTRMAATAKEGVVDRDGRVFGIDNLYIASPSVFPTSSHASATLTVVAMAIRLAGCLRNALLQRKTAPIVAIWAQTPFRRPSRESA